VRYVVIFVMLDTSQIVTPFNPLPSHRVAHSCDHATFKLHCCYEILQHFYVAVCPLRHMLNFRPYITQHHSVEILYSCCYGNKHDFSVSRYPWCVVGWRTGQSAHEVMLLQSQELWLVC